MDETRSGFHHCISRTVQQAFLLTWGLTGDRRSWLMDRLKELSDVYAIDCVSLAIMTNHLHTFLRNLPELVAHWSNAEVAYRWLLLHRSRRLRRRMGIDPDALPTRQEVERILAKPGEIDRLRARLSSISWFMKDLKEHLARRANEELGKRGSFWDPRFKSIHVLDEVGLLAVAGYIDLNPVRGEMVADPLMATYTSFEAHLLRLHESTAATLEGDEARADVHERDLALWRRVLTGDHEVAGNDEVFERLLAELDKASFMPAFPARREAHGVADSWFRNDPSDSETAGAALETAVVSSRPDVERTSGDTAPLPRALPPVPDVAPLSISLGDYFRRLRLLAQLEKLTDEGERVESLRELWKNARQEDRLAIENLATALTGLTGDGALQALGRTLGTTRLIGTAAGSAASLAAEALRRGRSRIVSTLARAA